jgi:DNA-directed RNA polymerase delta subunit
MTTGSVNYNAVLADLESRKAQIESAIAAVKAIIAASGVSFDGANGGVISPNNIPTGAFLRLSIADATKKFLDMVKTKQSVPQITQALERGGLPPAKTNTVYAVLRRRENDIGDIIRLGDEWALAEWYPNNPNLRKRTPEKPKAKKSKAKKKPTVKKAAPTVETASSADLDTIELADPQFSKADIAERIIRNAGEPVHAKEIADRLTNLYGKPSTNRTVAASMYQDPKKRFTNLGENLWDLTERQQEKDGAQI